LVERRIKMNVIFLDIDGVLNSEESIIQYYEKFQSEGNPRYDCDQIFPQKYMLNLKEIVDKANANIVVSSTWRIFYPDGDMWLKLIENLKEYGLDTKVIGVTRRLSGERGDEIREYLSRHPEITNFVILDDDSDMCEFTEIHLAKSSWKTGLTNEVKEKALKILNIN
jgi:hypothetical protein